MQWAEQMRSDMTTESLAEQYEQLSREGPERRRVDVALRGLDLVIAGFWLVLLSPALVLVAAAILLTSGSPLLYRGRRVGRHGRIFDMYKFRTLAPDAESRLGPYYGEELSRRTEDEVTGLGRVLRAAQLAEIPQRWSGRRAARRPPTALDRRPTGPVAGRRRADRPQAVPAPAARGTRAMAGSCRPC